MLPNVGFHRAANSIFGKVGRIASEQIVIQLMMSIANAYQANIIVWFKSLRPKSDIRSLDFVLNEFL